MPLGVFANAWAELKESLSLIPESVIPLIVLAASVGVALIVHGVIVAIIRRTLSPRAPFLFSLFFRLTGPFRLALVLFGMNVALAVTPIDSQLGMVLARILRVAFIALLGWITLTSINIAADVYLRRFDISAADNLLARKQVTQVRVLKGALGSLITLITIAVALMTFDQVRQLGVSLFASAGIAGIIVGLAARPMLSNLIAGVQLALTQPIRLEDAVVVENEMGFVEEITATYVVVRLWDFRRMIVPLTYFIEKPFQNWTHQSAALIGAVLLRVDFSAPIDRIRSKVHQIVEDAQLWDGRVLSVQVTDADDTSMELRVLVSAANAGATFDLRCEVREKLLAYLQREYPLALPRRRQEAVSSTGSPPLVPDTGGRRSRVHEHSS
jgi:small-conductance mechanosensitive channel